jgi:glycosyltransferase involved in cell wall biosynthesis
MKNKPLISCCTSTYGRLSKLSETVSCFLDQDYDNKELIILNNHPLTLECNLPDIKIYNEPIYPTLGDCRNRLIELANGEFIRTWDDDDLYFPWTLSQGIENIKDSPAWKPKKSWFWMKYKEPELAENVFEAAMLVRTDVAKKYGYLSKSGGNEHETLIKGIDKEGGCYNDDMGIMASYVYRWGWGMWHISGSLGSDNIENRTKTWTKHNNDVGDGRIKYQKLDDYWKYFSESFDCYKKTIIV